MQHRVLGLDLGKQADYTALALLEWEPPATPRRPVYDCRTLKRWPLGTPYTAIVAGLLKFLRQPELAGFVLVIDETGAGMPVVEMVCETLVRARVRGGLCAVSITGGKAVTNVSNGCWHVAKKVLASTLQVLLQSRRLHVSEQLPEAATLVKELQAFKVKLTEAGNETFEAWRERDHDDLVLAVALACWAAETLDLRPKELPGTTVLYT